MNGSRPLNRIDVKVMIQFSVVYFKNRSIASFWDRNYNRIILSCTMIILKKNTSKPACMNSYYSIQLRAKISRPAKRFDGDRIFLDLVFSSGEFGMHYKLQEFCKYR